MSSVSSGLAISRNSSAVKSEMRVIKLFSVYPRSNEVG